MLPIGCVRFEGIECGKMYSRHLRHSHVNYVHSKGWFTLRHKHNNNCKCEPVQHKHKHKHKKMETFPFSYAYVYAYVVMLRV